MDKRETSRRLFALREWMQARDISAFVVPMADPHGSEYVADHWKCIRWLTGFTGSAATVLVTADAACLWTDSRYWLQAAEQLADTPFTLMRDGAEGVPSMARWLGEKFPSGTFMKSAMPTVAGYAGTMKPGFLGTPHSAGEPQAFFVKPSREDPFEELWTDRPPLPRTPIVRQPEALCGLSARQKMARIWDELATCGHYCENFLLSDLAEIAWTLNLRGADIDYNPLFTAYLWLNTDGTAVLCIDPRKVTPDVAAYLEEQGVSTLPYTTGLKDLFARAGSLKSPIGATLECNYLVMTYAVQAVGQLFHQIVSPVSRLKSIKTPAEQDGFRRAMEKDGVALVQFLRQFSEASPAAGGQWTELSVDAALTARRAAQEGYCGLSFGTIAAYGAHGAIVHYEADAASDVPVQPRSLLLIDSGAQYVEGTTDVTRTLSCGSLTDEERRAYTLVLKAHIALSSLRFAEGTTGLELDLAARRPLWEAGYDYGHGTGHGVGSHLCVHEGPQQIRKDKRAATLVGFHPGMTVTDEPGIYVEGRFGVRLENTLLVVSDGASPFGRFCRFEPLTLCPFDLTPVVWQLITPQERAWINDYHATVLRRLIPLLPDEADRDFLRRACQPV